MGTPPGTLLYCTAPCQTRANGDRITYGQRGEVVRPATFTHGGKLHEDLNMRFPGNEKDWSCYLDYLSRKEPPPLPGDFKLGEWIYFTGPSHTFEDGQGQG